MLRDAPIRTRLFWLGFIASCTALVLACGTFVAYDIISFRESMVRDLETQGDIVGANSASALVFDDSRSAGETLGALRAEPYVISAKIFLPDGSSFASYSRDGQATDPTSHTAGRLFGNGYVFDSETLSVSREIVVAGKRAGSVLIVADLSVLGERIARILGIASVLFLVCMVVALAVASGLARSIAEPLRDLAATTKRISHEKNYALRAASSGGGGEVETLLSSVNEMLDEIQQRDTALQAARDELEHRVEQRTEELRLEILEREEAQRRLAQRADELVRSNAELEDFAYIASHDLKEPLRGIHNYSRILIDEYSEAIATDGRDKLLTLARLAQRLEGLLDNLLHYSRIGRLDLEVRPIDLNEVVGDVLDIVRASADDVEIRVPRPMPTVVCDHARAVEVFQNLIANAVKYNDKPDRWIEIGYVDPPGGGNAGHGDPVELYVRDNGIGIRDKHAASIFRIFKRLHGRDKFGGGVGAGLTIVKKIVERHNGKVRVESTYGEGTTFYFTLGAMTASGGRTAGVHAAPAG